MAQQQTALDLSNAALKKMKMDFGDRKKFNPDEQFPHISTGSIIANYLIGGSQIPGKDIQVCPGVPRGRIIEVYGPESSGKTTFAISVAVQAQLQGGTAAYLDFENALHDGYAQKIGLLYDDDKLDIWIPKSMEQGFELIETWVKNNVDVIIVDSVSAMVPQAILEESVTKEARIGLLARKMSGFLPRIVGSLNGSRSTLIFLNQVRSRIKTSMYDTGEDETTSGGKALKFYASLRIKLERKKVEWLQIVDPITSKEVKKTLGVYTKVTTVKNKLDSRQGDSGEIFIRYGKGIDNIRTVLDIAIERKIIKKGGSWYEYVNDKDANINFKLQGKESIQKLFGSNIKVYNALMADVLMAINQDNKNAGEEPENIDDGQIITEEINDKTPQEYDVEDSPQDVVVQPEDI